MNETSSIRSSASRQEKYRSIEDEDLDSASGQKETKITGGEAKEQDIKLDTPITINSTEGYGEVIGRDMWKQLTRVSMPIFNGDRRSYGSWKAAFMACVDKAPVTAECKLLQLNKYLSGEALKVVKSLGHSATAYEAAKERLGRKYGGQRRQVNLYIEELDNFVL